MKNQTNLFLKQFLDSKLVNTKNINSLNFGFSAINPNVKKLKTNSQVLEVGCGTGLLLWKLQCKYKKINFYGIEPGFAGFAEYRSLSARLSKLNNTKIYNKPYQDFKSDNQFDLIFAIDVFEHLYCPESFIFFLKKNIKKEGKCILVFPNLFFYEPHFNIFRIINKKITHFFFKKKISIFENNNNAKGLWNSLNFNALKHLKNCADIYDFKIQIFTTDNKYIIKRVATESYFKLNKPFIWAIANCILFLRIEVIFKLPLFIHFSPYYSVTLTNND
jgi:2-polyprenyl-3-methyl-5-hydroxy-6-metoxy-1,4-benzoquinol methylase